MADQGHIETEKVLVDIEREIYKEYSQAEKELADKIEDYFARFEKKKAIKLKALSEGKISQEEYDKWLIGQLAMGDRWKEMKETIAHDLGHASEMAMAISAGHMPEVYAINHDYGTFQVEKTSLVDTSYTLYDRNTAKRLFEDEHQFYHDHGWKVGKHINEGKLIPWEKKQAQSVMTQALLQGESIGKIATRLQNAFGNSILEEDIKNRDKMTAEQIAKELARRNRNASIRNARTMTTGVQNAGRVDSYKRADGMGIKLKQEWLATLDGRTRHEHRLLDGQRVAVGDKFVVDGYELEYPADPRGEAFLVYNCRCTLVPVLAGFEVDPSDTTLRHNAYLEEESYDEWKKNHASHSDPIDKQDRIAETMRRKYGAEYRKYAGLPDLPPTNNGGKKAVPVATNREEAYNILNNMFGSISDNVKALDEQLFIENINRLSELNARFGAIKEDNIGYITASPSGKTIAYTSGGFRDRGGHQDINLGLVGKFYKNPSVLEESEDRGRDTFFSMPFSDDYKRTYTITHEYGHILEAVISRGRVDMDALDEKVKGLVNPSGSQIRNVYKKAEDKCAKDIFKEIVDIAKEDNPNLKISTTLSDYGKTNHYEAFAEIFANSQCGDPNELGKAMQKWLKKEGF
jgi:hypothetical protein